jgi:hypothetical protein
LGRVDSEGRRLRVAAVDGLAMPRGEDGVTGLAVRDDGVCELPDERRKFTLESAALWLEESSDKEGMVAQLSGAHLSVEVARGDPEIAGEDEVFVLRVGSVAAAVAFHDGWGSVAFDESAAGFEQDLCPRLDQRALEGSDEQVRGLGIGLGVGGVDDAQDVACVLEQSVLEATAGSEKRKLAFTSELDGREGSLGVFVGAGGDTPYALKGAELGFRVLNGCGWNPGPVDGCAVVGGSKIESEWNRLMGRH